LRNLYGSDRYIRLLEGLGTILHLPQCAPDQTYLGGLDLKGDDGEFAYVWQEEFIQGRMTCLYNHHNLVFFAVVFHVATLMPNKESDPHCTAKKLHIGNDYVTIVYNDSGEEHKIGCIKVATWKTTAKKTKL
jgi:tuberous sclerosis protein 2